MKTILLDLLRCPRSGQPLELDAPVNEGEVREGALRTRDGAHSYPIRNGIPRFVPETGYADNFGMQWNKFARTQLDSHTGHPISADRFWLSTGWSPDQLNGQWVLDVGCGAGRFAEVALNAGAKVVALDYSSAVDAAQANLRQHENLHVVQGDVYALPFLRHSFPFVYSLGVLQHTPDVARAFAALPLMVEAGGALATDFYFKYWRTPITPKYWLRPLTKRVPQDKLFSALEKLTPGLLAVSRAVSRVPVLGPGLRRMVPVANYEDELPLDAEQLKEWALLDTFDWLAPAYDNPQTARTVRAWAEAAGLVDIVVERPGHLVCRGRMPDRAHPR
jgi:SAM-dependent methyltransferase